MHELGIVFHIMDSLEEVAKENQVTQIRSVTVEVGEVSTVLPDYLTDCWNWAVNSSRRACKAAFSSLKEAIRCCSAVLSACRAFSMAADFSAACSIY